MVISALCFGHATRQWLDGGYDLARKCLDAKLGYSESVIANVALEKSRRVTSDSPLQPVSFHALSRPHRFTSLFGILCPVLHSK